MGTAFRAAFRALALSGLPLKTIAERLSQHHWDEGEETRRKYVTALLLQLDCGAGKVEWVNAGHNPGFLLPTESGAPVLLESSGTPLGMMPGMEYEAEEHDLPEGARLVVYTDGLTEVFQGTRSSEKSGCWRAFARARAPAAKRPWRTCGAASANSPVIVRRMMI